MITSYKSRVLLLTLLSSLVFCTLKAQVKIGDNPTTISGASLLELETTNKGFVLPRVSLTNVTAYTPLSSDILTGTIVYNINSSVTGGYGTGIYIWNGTQWQYIVTRAALTAWSLTGNSGNTRATNFLGNIDTAALIFKVNNNLAGLIEGTSGNNNTFIGYQAGQFSTGINNVALGKASLLNNTTGYNNVSIGANALNINTTGFQNTALGYSALYNNTTGSFNTVTGSYALYSNTTGIRNTVSGYAALYSNTTGSRNSAFGSYALQANTSGSNNTSIGYNTLNANVSGANNTSIGYGAMETNTSGSNNTSLGYVSLDKNTTGNSNTSVGYFALNNNTTGNSIVAVGYNSGTSNTTGTLNTLVGSQTDVLSASLTNAGAIGYNAKVALNNSLVLGDTTSGTYAVNVGIGVRNPLKRLHIDAAPVAGGAKDSLKIDNLAASSSAYNKSVLVIDSSTGYVSRQNISTLAGNNWSITGNNGTNASANFLGTMDNADLVFRTNNAENMRITAAGRVGIGTSSPGSKLEVNGALKITDGTQGASKVLTSDVNGLASWQSVANSLGLSGNTLTSTVNGVAATSNAISGVSNTSSVNSLTTTVNGVAAAGINIINSNTKTWTQSGGLTTNVNGISSNITPATGTITNILGYNSTGAPVYQSASGILGGSTNALALSGNTLTSTVNGVAATSNAISGVSNTSSVNSLTTTVNGVAAAGINIINSNTKTWTQSGGLTTNVNGISSNITPATGTITNILGYNSTGAPVYQSASGILGGSTNSLGLSGNTLTSTVNGVAATSNAVSGVSNTSSANTIKTTVNGVAGSTVNIINTNTNALTQAGGLVNTVNGVAATTSISSGTIQNSLGFNASGNAVYAPVVDFYASNTGAYTAVTANNSTLTDANQTSLVNKGGGTFAASTGTYTVPATGVYEVEEMVKYGYNQSQNATDAKIYYARLNIDGTTYSVIGAIPYNNNAGITLSTNSYTAYVKEVVSLSAGATITAQGGTYGNGGLNIYQFRVETFHVKKVD